MMKTKQSLRLAVSILSVACVACVAASSITCAQVVGLDHEYVDGQATTGGGGGGGACAPKSTKPCYSGPLGTEMAGACKAGQQTCRDDGSGFGPCEGEILPKTEDCLNKVDDDCNGAVNDLCPCTPGTTQPCYSGPMGTEGVGTCKAGTQQCNDNGVGFGPCVGSVGPAPEECATADDEDCDNAAFSPLDSDCACVPSSPTSCSTGLLGACAMGSAPCDESGTVVGSCMQAVFPGFDDCVTAEDEDCDGASTSCTGATVSGFETGSSVNEDAFFAVAVDSAQNTIAGGVFDGQIDQYIVSEGSLGLVKLAPNGAQIWAKSFTTGPLHYAVVRDIAVDADDSIIIVGELHGDVDLGGGTLSSTGGSTDVLLAKFDTNGTHVWSKRFGDNSYQGGAGVTVDSSKRIYITGLFGGQLEFGGNTVTGSGGADVFVAAFDKDSNLLWARDFGDGADQLGIDIDATGGAVIMVGEFAGNMNFGVDLLSSAGEADIFVAKLAMNDGDVQWAKRFGDGKFQGAFGVVANAADIALTGAFKGTLDFGNGPLVNADPANDELDGYVAKLEVSDGSVKWSMRFGDNREQLSERVDMDGAGNVLVVGHFNGTIDLGGGPIPNSDGSGNSSDIFAAKLSSATGAHLWSRGFGEGGNNQRAYAVAADATGGARVAGWLLGSVDFGPPLGVLTSQGDLDAYAVRLAP